MKSVIVKSGLCLLFAALLVNEAEAQRRSNRRGAQPTTTNPTTQQQTNNNRPTGYDPYGGLPITVDSSGVSDTMVRRSLRNDNAFDKKHIERTYSA